MRKNLLAAVMFLAIFGGLAAWLFLKPDSSRRALAQREVATRGLADFLAQRHPSAKVLVVSNPFVQKVGQPKHVRLFEDAGVRGLEQVLGKDRVKVAYAPLKPGALEDPHSFEIPATSTTPVAYLLADEAFDTLAGKNPEYTVMVSLIGIPKDLAEHHLWEAANAPKLAFLLPELPMLGTKDEILKAFQSGKVLAAVLNRPGESANKKSSTTFADAFILATAENIQELAEQHPSLFEPVESPQN